MAFEIQSVNVDVLQDRATIQITDQTSGEWVSVSVKIQTPGNQPENRLFDISKAAARKALQEALAAL